MVYAFSATACLLPACLFSCSLVCSTHLDFAHLDLHIIHTSQVSFKKGSEIHQHLRDALPMEERWTSSKIRLIVDRLINFWHRDLRAVILKLYGSVKSGAGFAYRYDSSAKSKPHGTTVWKREEAAVQERLGAHAVIAGVQIYADATVVNLKGASVHPVYICLLNQDYTQKIRCIELIAYLPELPNLGNMPSEQVRLLKLKLFHAAFDVLLRPLREMKMREFMTGPDGCKHFVVPVLLNLCGDNLEVSLRACLRSTKNN